MQEDKKLTTADLTEMYGVSLMTINNWRKGSTRITPLPFHTEPQGGNGMRSRVYFLNSEVKSWASSNQIFEIRR